MVRVLVTDEVSEKALELMKSEGIEVDVLLKKNEDELVTLAPNYDGFVIRSGVKITKKVLEAGANGKLKIIGRAGVGVDNVDKEAAKELGIVVENTPFGNTNAAAEQTLALMMLCARPTYLACKSMKEGKWDRKSFEGTELKLKTLGLIGFGNVGKKVARVAQSLEMNVIVYDPFLPEEKFKELGVKKAELEEIYTNSDYITVHVPLTEKTKDMINEEQFNKMKNGVRILNVARGGVINEGALLNAIKLGKVAAAGLDVYTEEPPLNKELIMHERVTCTPHLGASTIEAQENVGIEVAEQIVLALKKGEVKNCVNGLTKLRE
ncbi:MAG: hydroxyacid dehydrogenase [Candidatus ainarchaeum sp.]|nr:hydroxyacid dehydrogenase [Candidatus ainarchaeum sp.]